MSAGVSLPQPSEASNSCVFDPDAMFAPFSIRAEGLGSLTHESAYVALRDSVMTKAFPQSASESDPARLKDYRKAAGLAIKSLVSLAVYEGAVEHEWYLNAVSKAQSMGVEVHRGKGLTLQNPQLIVQAAAQQPSGIPARSNPAITPVLAAFAQQTAVQTNYEHDKLSYTSGNLELISK